MYRQIRVEPLAGVIGAEVSGLDLRKPLDAEAIDEIRRAWLAHQVLFFRDQPLTIDEHKAFARRFGELHVHPVLQQMADQGHPEIVVLESDARRPVVADRWHSDVTFEREPPLGSILRAVAVPDAGGDTMWASMTAAYDALSEPMKGVLAPLRAVHSGAAFRKRATEKQTEALAQNETTTHPVIRTHPETGRKAIFVNSDVHARDRRHEAARGRGAARIPVRARRLARVLVPLPLAEGLDRDVGQPLYPTPGGGGQPVRLPAHGAGDPDRRSALLNRAC